MSTKMEIPLVSLLPCAWRCGRDYDGVVSSDGNEWFVKLAGARKQLGVSQAELAARSHVSLVSIRSYEGGKRHPSRPYLTAVLDALQCERGVRSEIMAAAGFAPDGYDLRPAFPAVFSTEEATAEVARAPWPAFVTTEYMEVLAANSMAQAVWGVDLRQEFTETADRNLLVVAGNPRFADQCENWDDIVGRMASIYKGHHRGAETLDEPSAYFSSVLDRFIAGDPAYVARFFKLWQAAQPSLPRMRWSYDVQWRHPVVGPMRFHALVGAGNEILGFAFNDWIPVDSETWLALGSLASPSK
jgi:transcriptional regulator with XRE-family HTH domain